jgi:hypothetical protein
MKKKFGYKESRGLPGGPNEMFTYVTGVFSTDGYKANSPDVNNPFNIIPSGDITMEGVNFPVRGTDNLGNTKVMMPGNNYKFPGDMVFEVPMAQDGIEVPKRQGSRKNPDGTESTHLMATETLDGKNWFSFPTLFQDSDGTWIDMSNKPWQEAYEEAKRRGEVIDFGTDKEAAIKFGEGSWKTPKYQQRGEVSLDPRRTIEQDNTRVKQVIVPQEFRQPSRPAQPQATISQYNPPSTFEYLLNKAANPMTTLGYVARGQDIPDRVLDKDNAFDYAFDIINPAAWLDYGIKAVDDLSEGDFVGAGLNTLGAIPAVPATVANAKNITKVVNKIPAKVNPNYFTPNSNMYYRGIGREGMQDALESGLFRAKPADKIPERMVDLGIGQIDMAKRFNKTYYSPRFNVADRYGAGYIAEVPKDAAKFGRRYKGSDWSMSTRDQIPVSEGRILEKNWWSGYKPVKQDGGEETSWTDYINPMNWGVTNRDEAGDFKQAFRAARADGDDEFMWHGERYNTELAPTPEKPKEEKLFYNPSVLEGLSEEQAARRQALLNAANVVAQAQGDDENLRRLLVMSAAMENTLGADPNAYGRDYTRGPMSIDDIAYQDLFAIREGAGGYTTQQKKNAAWLNELGIDTNNIEQVLRSDDPLAGMAAARLVYGRAPEALPSGDDPDALYNYYLKYYNKGGIDKYGGAEAHRKKFNDFYNQLYRQEGGEQNQFQIYKDYVYGVYDGTEMQKPAEKIYDKLNRVYYKEAKQSGTTVPNYILSKVMNQRG